MAGGKTIVKKTSMSPKNTWIKLDYATALRSLLDMDKYDLMYQVHIDARDFRILDPLLSCPSTILPRENHGVFHLRGYIDDTEDYINIHIDNHRNQLIQLELFLSSAHISLAFYALVCGLFGVSIPYPWNQNHGYMFKWVVIYTGVFSAILFFAVVAYAHKKD